MRVVLDTSVIVRAAFRRHLDSDNLVARAVRQDFELITSQALINELATTLNAGRLGDRFMWKDDELERYVETYIRKSILVHPDMTLKVARDASDDRFLEAALAGDADCLVTEDRDLLNLGEFRGVRILNTAGFFALLSEQTS